MRNPITLVSAVLVTLTLGAGVALAAGTTASDPRDTSNGIDVSSASLVFENQQALFAVHLFQRLATKQLQDMRWALDLNGDGVATDSSDACIVLAPARDGHTLRAKLFAGCTGTKKAATSATVKANVVKLQFTLAGLRSVGLPKDATKLAYHLTVTDSQMRTDDVPDDPNGLVVGGARPAVPDPTPGTTDTPTPSTSPTPSNTTTASPKPTKTPNPNNTIGLGKTSKTTVSPGDAIDISGSGFANSTHVDVFLATATTTATGAPIGATSTASQSSDKRSARGRASLASSGRRHRSKGPSTADAVKAHVTALLAKIDAPPGAVNIGTGTSDGSGNFNAGVTIPTTTKPGPYALVEEGANTKGATNILRALITVAAAAKTSPSTNVPLVQSAAGTSAGGKALSNTGADVQGLAGMGLLSLALGLCLLLIRRLASRRAPRSSLEPIVIKVHW